MKQWAFGALVTAGIIAGTTGILIKNIEMDAKAISWVRMGLPTIIIGTWIWIKKLNIIREGFKPMLIASTLNALRMYLYILAFVLTSIGKAAIIFYSWPIFTTILGIYFLKEKVKPFHIFLIGISFIGLIIAYSDRAFTSIDNDLIGMLAALIASLFYAVTVVIFKSQVHRYEKIEMIFFQNVVGSVLFLPFFISIASVVTLNDIVLSSTYAILVGMFVFYLFFIGLTHLKAYVASAVMYLEVVSAVILGYIFLGEVLTTNMILGGSMILISSFMLNQKK